MTATAPVVAPEPTPVAGGASMFTSDAWAHALRAGYGLDVQQHEVAGPAGAVDSLRYCRVDDLRGARIVSLPFSDYCDPQLASPSGWSRLVDPLLDEGLPVSVRVLRSVAPAGDARFEVTGRAAWHQTAVLGDDDAQWDGLASAARQNVRRAERHGVSVRFTSALADLERFHALHVSLRKSKYRMLAQPRAFFEGIHEAFAPAGHLWLALAEENGELVAGTLYLQSGDRLYYKFNASTAPPSRPNDLLVWEGLKLASRHGLAALDFGLSDLDQDGLLRFKEKYATERAEITSYRYVPAGAAHRTDEAARLLGALTDLLTESEVPDGIAARAGDLLYHYFC